MSTKPAGRLAAVASVVGDLAQGEERRWATGDAQAAPGAPARTKEHDAETP